MKESKKRKKAAEGSGVKKKRDVSERDSEHARHYEQVRTCGRQDDSESRSLIKVHI